jgi:hypothetical protein
MLKNMTTTILATKNKKKIVTILRLYSFCDYRMQFCRGELKDLSRPKRSPLFIALKVISLNLT